MYIPIVETEDGIERFVIRISDRLGEGQTAEVWLGKKTGDVTVQRAIKIPNEGSTLADLGALERELAIVTALVNALRMRGIADAAMPVPLMWRGKGGEKAPYLLIMELVPSEWRLKSATERKEWSFDDSESLLWQHLQLLDALHTCGYSTYGDRKMDDLRWNSKSKRLIVIDWNRANQLPDAEPVRSQAIKDDLRIMARLLAEAHLGFPIGDLERVPEVDSERHLRWLAMSRLARRIIHYCDRPVTIGGYRDARQALEDLKRGPIEPLDAIQRELIGVSDPIERAQIERRQLAESAKARAEHVRAYRDAYEFIGAERYPDALRVVDLALQRMPTAIDMEQAPHIWLGLFHLQAIAKTALALIEGGVDPDESDRLLGELIGLTSRPDETPPRVATTTDFRQIKSALQRHGLDQFLDPWVQEIAARDSPVSDVDGVSDPRLARAIRHMIILPDESGRFAKPGLKVLETFATDVTEFRRTVLADPRLLFDKVEGQNTIGDEIDRLSTVAKAFGPSASLGGDVHASLEVLDWLRTIRSAVPRAQAFEVCALLDACYAAAQPPKGIIDNGGAEPNGLLEYLVQEAQTRLRRLLDGPVRPWQLMPLMRYSGTFDTQDLETGPPSSIGNLLPDHFDDVRKRVAAQIELREGFEKRYRQGRHGDSADSPAQAVEGIYDSSQRLDPAHINWKWVMGDPLALDFVRRAVESKVELYDNAPPGAWLIDQVSLVGQTKEIADLQGTFQATLVKLREQQVAANAAAEELQAWLAANSFDSQRKNPDSPIGKLAATRHDLEKATKDAEALNNKALEMWQSMSETREQIHSLMPKMPANQMLDELLSKARQQQFDLLYSRIVERLRMGDTKGIAADIDSLKALGVDSRAPLIALVVQAHDELLKATDLADDLQDHIRKGSTAIDESLRKRIADAGPSFKSLFGERLLATDGKEDLKWNLQQVLNRMAANEGKLDQTTNGLLTDMVSRGTLVGWIAREWVSETEHLARRCNALEALIRPEDPMTPATYSPGKYAQVAAALKFCLDTRASLSDERLKALGKSWERLVEALVLASGPLEGVSGQTALARDIRVLLAASGASPSTSLSASGTYP